MKHNSKNKRGYIFALYFIAIIAVCVFIIKVIMNWDATSSVLSNAFSILFPFIGGLFIAYFIYPLSKMIEENMLHRLMKQKLLKWQKLLAILLSYIIVLGLIITVLFYIFPQLMDSIMQLRTIFDSAQSGYQQLMNKLQNFDQHYPAVDLSAINEFMETIPEKILSFIPEVLPKIIPTIYTTSMSFISGILNTLIAIIVSVYLLIDKTQLLNNIKRLVYAILGEKRADRLIQTAKECNKIFGNFIIGKMVDSLIIGILCFIAMSILKLPYAMIISVIVGVTNMIPYFGPFIGAIPGILLLLIIDFKYGLIFGILILVLQQFDGLFLGPKILGESTGLRPVWIIFAITIGGSLGGVLGMFLGVPILAVIAYLTNNLIERRLMEKQIHFHTDETTGILLRTEKTDTIKADSEEFSETEELKQ